MIFVADHPVQGIVTLVRNPRMETGWRDPTVDARVDDSPMITLNEICLIEYLAQRAKNCTGDELFSRPISYKADR